MRWFRSFRRPVGSAAKNFPRADSRPPAARTIAVAVRASHQGVSRGVGVERVAIAQFFLCFFFIFIFFSLLFFFFVLLVFLIFFFFFYSPAR